MEADTSEVPESAGRRGRQRFRLQTRRQKILAGILVLLLIVLVVEVYWQLVVIGPAARGSTIATNQARSQKVVSASQEVPTSAYTSANYSLGLKYPKGWTVSDKAGAPLTVTSPVGQITTASHGAVSGREVMSIQPKGQLPAAFGQQAVAVLDSQALTYTRPTNNQRPVTHLTFVQYNATTTKGGLDAIYLTGHYQYKKDQAIPATDMAALDPLVIVSFVQCSDAACTGSTSPLTVASTYWQSAGFNQPLKTLLGSLAFY